MLNERDGGIGGVKIVVEECETGYDNKKGVECYESVKSKKPVGDQRPIRPASRCALIPKAAVDNIPILSMAYGLSASAVGKDFPWIFNPPATYWDGLSIILRYIGGKEGGLDKLKGKTIGYIYLRRRLRPRADAAARAARQGLRLQREAISGAAGRDAEPVRALAQRPPRPAGLHDHVGLGRDEPDRRAGSRQDRLPMDHFIGVWWSGSEDDARPAGAGGQGLSVAQLQRGRRRTSRRSRTSRSTSSTRARARPPKDKVGENFYNRGVLNSVLIAEAIRNAQKLTGKKVITGEEMRRGLETLKITRGALEGDRPRGLRGADAGELRRPQRPQLGLHAAVGRHQVGQGLRLDRADEGQGHAADRRRPPRTMSARTPAGRSAPRLATSRRKLRV